jgi:hypothetical protein
VTVATDKSNPLFGIKLEISAVKQHLRTEAFFKILNSDHVSPQLSQKAQLGVRCPLSIVRCNKKRVYISITGEIQEEIL